MRQHSNQAPVRPKHQAKSDTDYTPTAQYSDGSTLLQVLTSKTCPLAHIPYSWKSPCSSFSEPEHPVGQLEELAAQSEVEHGPYTKENLETAWDFATVGACGSFGKMCSTHGSSPGEEEVVDATLSPVCAVPRHREKREMVSCIKIDGLSGRARGHVLSHTNVLLNPVQSSCTSHPNRPRPPHSFRYYPNGSPAASGCHYRREVHFDGSSYRPTVGWTHPREVYDRTSIQVTQGHGSVLDVSLHRCRSIYPDENPSDDEQELYDGEADSDDAVIPSSVAFQVADASTETDYFNAWVSQVSSNVAGSDASNLTPQPEVYAFQAQTHLSITTDSGELPQDASEFYTSAHESAGHSSSTVRLSSLDDSLDHASTISALSQLELINWYSCSLVDLGIMEEAGSSEAYEFTACSEKRLDDTFTLSPFSMIHNINGAEVMRTDRWPQQLNSMSLGDVELHSRENTSNGGIQRQDSSAVPSPSSPVVSHLANVCDRGGKPAFEAPCLEGSEAIGLHTFQISPLPTFTSSTFWGHDSANDSSNTSTIVSLLASDTTSIAASDSPRSSIESLGTHWCEFDVGSVSSSCVLSDADSRTPLSPHSASAVVKQTDPCLKHLESPPRSRDVTAPDSLSVRDSPPIRPSAGVSQLKATQNRPSPLWSRRGLGALHFLFSIPISPKSLSVDPFASSARPIVALGPAFFPTLECCQSLLRVPLPFDASVTKTKEKAGRFSSLEMKKTRKKNKGKKRPLCPLGGLIGFGDDSEGALGGF